MYSHDSEGHSNMTQLDSAGREHDVRPWGAYTVLDEGDGYKVKRIEVSSGKRLSYQRHTRRAEHWYLVQGRGLVTRDGVGVEFNPDESIEIAMGQAHRIENIGPDTLVFIEVQRGDYFGEDDVVRIEDDFGRAG